MNQLVDWGGNEKTNNPRHNQQGSDESLTVVAVAQTVRVHAVDQGKPGHDHPDEDQTRSHSSGDGLTDVEADGRQRNCHSDEVDHNGWRLDDSEFVGLALIVVVLAAAVVVSLLRGSPAVALQVTTASMFTLLPIVFFERIGHFIRRLLARRDRRTAAATESVATFRRRRG